MADNDRIDEVLGVILADPDAHRQALWVNNVSQSTAGALRHDCGTTACIAGWAVLLFCPQDTVITAGGLSVPLIGGRAISVVASELLGLTREQADAIFYSRNERAITMLKHVKDHPDATACDLYDLEAAS